MDPCKEAEFLKAECKRLCDKIKAAEEKGAVKGISKKTAEIKEKQA